MPGLPEHLQRQVNILHGRCGGDVLQWDAPLLSGGTLGRLEAIVRYHDASTLTIEQRFKADRRTTEPIVSWRYRFHYQDSVGRLIERWDKDAAHGCHRHVGPNDDRRLPDSERTLEGVLDMVYAIVNG
jgi:hypothetical protein